MKIYHANIVVFSALLRDYLRNPRYDSLMSILVKSFHFDQGHCYYSENRNKIKSPEFHLSRLGKSRLDMYRCALSNQN